MEIVTKRAVGGSREGFCGAPANYLERSVLSSVPLQLAVRVGRCACCLLILGVCLSAHVDGAGAGDYEQPKKCGAAFVQLVRQTQSRPVPIAGLQIDQPVSHTHTHTHK
jgi:hypothetical protein